MEGHVGAVGRLLNVAQEVLRPEGFNQPESLNEPPLFRKSGRGSTLQVHEPAHDKDGQPVVPQGGERAAGMEHVLFRQGLEQRLSDDPRRGGQPQPQVIALRRNVLVGLLEVDELRDLELPEGVVVHQFSFCERNGNVSPTMFTNKPLATNRSHRNDAMINLRQMYSQRMQ